MDADAIELRVLGCLLEKQRTTPDQYPLTLNALRLACNQTTNRDPIVSYDEREIHEALQRLARRGWTRVASGPGSRAAKYRQLFDEELGARARRHGGPLRPDAPRRADARRAQAANGAPPSVRWPRRRHGDPRRPHRARARPASRPAPGAEGGALPPPPRRRGDGGERRGATTLSRPPSDPRTTSNTASPGSSPRSPISASRSARSRAKATERASGLFGRRSRSPHRIPRRAGREPATAEERDRAAP